MLRTFIQVAALALTLEAAIFLAKGSLTLSQRAIAELASTHWNHNRGTARNLASQAADTRISVGLLLLAFGFQMWNSVWPMRWVDFGVDKRGLALALVFAAGMLVLGAGLSRIMARQYLQQVELILSSDSPNPARQARAVGTVLYISHRRAANRA